MNKSISSVLVERFWSKIEKTDHCWHWLGATNNEGRGKIKIPKTRETVLATRLSYAIANNMKWLDTSLFVCHTCDNPNCVNPKHLYLGTNQTNMKDAASRGLLNNDRPRGRDGRFTKGRNNLGSTGL